MIKCKDIVHQASDYLDKDLTRMQALGMALHLLMCGDCRRFIRYFRLGLRFLSVKKRLDADTAARLTDTVISEARQDSS